MKYFVIIDQHSLYGVEMLKKPDCLMAGPHPVLAGIELRTEGIHYVSLVLDPECFPMDQRSPEPPPPRHAETYIPHSAVVAVQAGGDAATGMPIGFL